MSVTSPIKAQEGQIQDEQIRKVEDVGKLLEDLKKFTDEKLEIFKSDMTSLQKDFSGIIIEYDQITTKSQIMFQEAINSLKDENSIAGVTKFVIKGAGAAFNYGLAWWKKKNSLKEFKIQLEALKKERGQAISRKLEDLDDLHQNHIPFLREKIILSLEQLLSFVPKQERLKLLVKEKTEEAILLYFKASFLKGGVLYLQNALTDARDGKLFLGDIKVWENEILNAPKELTNIFSEKGWLNHPVIKDINSESKFFGEKSE